LSIFHPTSCKFGLVSHFNPKSTKFAPKLIVMENIIIIPKNEKQSNVIKAFLAEMKIRFKTVKDDSIMTEEDFYSKIDRSIQQAKDGKTHGLTPELKKELFKNIL